MFIDNEIIRQLSTSKIHELESIAHAFYSNKRHEYKRTGNSNSILDSLSYFLNIAGANKLSNASYSVALIYKFKSQLILEQAMDTIDLMQSMENINKAIEMLSSFSSNLSNEGIDCLISSHLVRAVIFKVLGDKKEAFYSIDNSKRDLQKMDLLGNSLIKLNRQEQIMEQTILSHKYLMEEAMFIRKKSSIEFYSSYKRLFEFYLNNKMYDKSLKAYDTFVDSFTKVNSELPTISKISFMKNIGQYNIAIGNEKEAMKILFIALKKATELSLNGQILQIRVLIESISSNNSSLITFEINE